MLRVLALFLNNNNNNSLITSIILYKTSVTVDFKVAFYSEVLDKHILVTTWILYPS